MKKLKLILPGIFLLVLLSVAIGTTEEVKKTSAVTTESSEGIKWYDLDQALPLAKEQNKHIFIDFSTAWCGYCKKMDKEVFTKKEVIDLLNNDYIAVKVNGDGTKELEIDGYKVTEKDLTKREFKVTGYPTFWWLTADGKKLFKESGYRPADFWIQALTWVKDFEYDSTLSKDGTPIIEETKKN